jgi:CHASE3 domain sensor protein
VFHPIKDRTRAGDATKSHGFAAARWKSASLIVVGIAIFLTALIVPWALIVRA